jgi:hypothetical protein
LKEFKLSSLGAEDSDEEDKSVTLEEHKFKSELIRNEGKG